MARRYTTLYLVSRLQSELDRVFAEATELSPGPFEAAELQPALDIIETPETLQILIEVPGLGAADLDIKVRGRLLDISGSRGSSSHHSSAATFHCLERNVGRFRRSIHLPEKVDPWRGSASLARGILEIRLPKIDDRRGQTQSISIEETDD